MQPIRPATQFLKNLSKFAALKAVQYDAPRFASQGGSGLVSKFMTRHKIVPDLLPQPTPHKAEVSYFNVKVKMGMQVPPIEARDTPCVSWRHDKNKFYTLFMIDPDAPSRCRPVDAEWHHWLVVNIPGNRVCRGNTIYEYIGPAPPLYTGLHRYTFLVYQQPKKIDFKEGRLCSTSAEGRGRRSVKQFACKYNLGNPIASNFFYAKWDQWVDEIYKEFKRRKDTKTNCTSKRTCQYCYK